jgi:glycosyltransferase involved in cell wall biosynthesis
MSLVSIIIPVKNGEKTIERAVRSCISQSYNNIEVIVVDNLSTDKTQNVLRNFDYDTRVKLVLCDIPGVSHARNKGLAICEGRYVCFLDADDELLKDSVLLRVNALISEATLFVHTAYVRRHGANEKIISSRRAKLSLFNWYNPVGNLTGLYDAKEIGLIYQSARHHEDYLMWWEVVEAASGKTSYISEPTAIYNVTPNSLSSSFKRNLIGHVSILREKNCKYNPLIVLYIMYYIINGLSRRLF